jgi:hypothetical protein
MALALIAELGDDIGIEPNVALAAFALRQFETKREFIGLLQCATDLNFFLIESDQRRAKSSPRRMPVAPLEQRGTTCSSASVTASMSSAVRRPR